MTSHRVHAGNGTTMTDQRHIFGSALDLFAAVLGACVCVAWLVVFQDRFIDGATWSGLNPGGGGPGFLLIVSAGSLGFFIRSKTARTMAALPAIVYAAVFAVACGACFALIASQLVTLPSDMIMSMASAVTGAYFVPRVVSSVLNESWKHAHAARAYDGTE
ncbi:MAG: hypothetical protein RIE77_10775 [Phycisphaerales bacterium]|jgi:drug/metabolite transporter (DMT)-like permease